MINVTFKNILLPLAAVQHDTPYLTYSILMQCHSLTVEYINTVLKYHDSQPLIKNVSCSYTLTDVSYKQRGIFSAN